MKRPEGDYIDRIVGYRIIREFRNPKQYGPQVLVIWSRMTNAFHRLYEGSEILGAINCGDKGQHYLRYVFASIDRRDVKSPESVGDELLRTALILDEVACDYGGDSNKYMLWHLMISLLSSSCITTWGNRICSVGKCTGIADDPGLPMPVRVLRQLRVVPGLTNAMLVVSDNWGLPQNILGEALGHADKFRTL